MGRAPYPARVGGDSMTVLAGLGELQQYSCTRKVWANTGLNIDRAPRASPAPT